MHAICIVEKYSEKMVEFFFISLLQLYYLRKLEGKGREMEEAIATLHSKT